MGTDSTLNNTVQGLADFSVCGLIPKVCDHLKITVYYAVQGDSTLNFTVCRLNPIIFFQAGTVMNPADLIGS